MVSEELWCPTCGSPWPTTIKASAVPRELRELPLYAENKQLLARWEELMQRWRRQCPGVDPARELQKAHNWEVDHPTKRKTNKVAFLSNWMTRAQERAGRSPGYTAPAPRSSQPVDGIRVELLRAVQSYDGMKVGNDEITPVGIRQESGIVPWSKVPTHRLEYLKLQVELCNS